MRRATEIRRCGEWNAAAAVDTVVLDASERGRRRVVLTAKDGARFLLDLPHATMLHDGDGLVLDDGRIVQVSAKPEPLMEIAAEDAHHLARLAWHLGNRHTDVEVAGDRLLIRSDHVLAAMLAGLGAAVTEIEAPFDPEPGAYAGHGHTHDHADVHDTREGASDHGL